MVARPARDLAASTVLVVTAWTGPALTGVSSVDRTTDPIEACAPLRIRMARRRFATATVRACPTDRRRAKRQGERAEEDAVDQVAQPERLVTPAGQAGAQMDLEADFDAGAQELPERRGDWLHQHKQQSPHTDCGTQLPFSRFSNVSGHYT